MHATIFQLVMVFYCEHSTLYVRWGSMEDPRLNRNVQRVFHTNAFKSFVVCIQIVCLCHKDLTKYYIGYFAYTTLLFSGLGLGIAM